MVTRTAVPVEDYFDFLYDPEEKLEYYDGEIGAMLGAQPYHNIITVNLTLELVLCLKKGLYCSKQRSAYQYWAAWALCILRHRRL